MVQDSESWSDDLHDLVFEPVSDRISQFHLPEYSTDRTTSRSRILFFAFLLAVGVVILLFGGGAAGYVTDTVFGQPPSEYITTNDTLYIETEDSAYLSRIFSETTHEVAYCEVISGNKDRPTVTVWMADTINAGPDQIEFLTENCPDATQEVLLHTHPNGNLQLSEQDKRTITERSERFICVQGGPITTDPGVEVENMACYQQAKLTTGEPTFVQIQVATLDGSDTNS